MALDATSSHKAFHTRRPGSAEHKFSHSRLEPGHSVSESAATQDYGQGKWLLHAYYI